MMITSSGAFAVQRVLQVCALMDVNMNRVPNIPNASL